MTHPDIKRFFMTIPEASKLVIQASAIGKGGEIFVLNMGTQIKIVDMAKNLIAFCGLKPGADIDIIYTGLRPGEKLYEELFDKREEMQESHIPDIKVAINHNDGNSGDNWHNLNKNINTLERLSSDGNRAGIIKKLQQIVTNYQPSSKTISLATKEVA